MDSRAPYRYDIPPCRNVLRCLWSLWSHLPRSRWVHYSYEYAKLQSLADSGWIGTIRFEHIGDMYFRIEPWVGRGLSDCDGAMV